MQRSHAWLGIETLPSRVHCGGGVLNTNPRPDTASWSRGIRLSYRYRPARTIDCERQDDDAQSESQAVVADPRRFRLASEAALRHKWKSVGKKLPSIYRRASLSCALLWIALPLTGTSII